MIQGHINMSYRLESPHAGVLLTYARHPGQNQEYIRSRELQQTHIIIIAPPRNSEQIHLLHHPPGLLPTHRVSAELAPSKKRFGAGRSPTATTARACLRGLEMKSWRRMLGPAHTSLHMDWACLIVPLLILPLKKFQQTEMFFSIEI